MILIVITDSFKVLGWASATLSNHFFIHRGDMDQVLCMDKDILMVKDEKMRKLTS